MNPNDVSTFTQEHKVSEFTLFTSNPIALDSRDHIVPGGTMMDDTRNESFVHKVIELFVKRYNRPFAYLDLGCSSGGLVEDVLGLALEYDHPVTAVGLEGSDYSLARGRGGWNQDSGIPNNLFTCDITKPFTLCSSRVLKACQPRQPYCGPIFSDGISLGQAQRTYPFRFDVVTAWEVMEHIAEGESLDCLVKNVLNHLMPDGIWMMSVSSSAGYHHRTVRGPDWWFDKFDSFGFARDFETEAIIGKDWPRMDGGSFNVALRRNNFYPDTP